MNFDALSGKYLFMKALLSSFFLFVYFFASAQTITDQLGGVERNFSFHSNSVRLDVIKQTFEVNFFGTVAVTQAMLPLIHKSDAGRIVNISSDMASLTLHQDPSFKFYDYKQLAYDSSKTAVNAFTIHLAHELKDTNIKVNSAHPGWIKTDMGTDDGELTIDEGAATPVWLATLPEGGASGSYFGEDRQPMPW